jgi:hypothetical protein
VELGFAVLLGLAAELRLAGELGLEVKLGLEVAGVWDGDADAGAEPEPLPDDGDVLGEAGALGASCAQAAMTARLLVGSALPPTPLGSTK